MATQTHVVVYSDLSGDPEASTVNLKLFGTEYELDLTAAESERLEALLQPYLTVARRVGGRRARGVGSAPARPRGAQAKTGASSGEIREWARTHGYEISDRGRIPAPVQEAFLAAQKSDTPSTTVQNGTGEKAAPPRARAKKKPAGAGAAAAKPARQRARKTTTP